jgi:hypothetical protein
MAISLLYQSGDEVRKGDRVLLHGKPGEVEFVLDGDDNVEGWPQQQFGRGIMIAEADCEDLIFVSRCAGSGKKNSS